VLAPLLAFGVLALAQLIARYVPALPVSSLRLVSVICLIAIATSALGNYRWRDQSRNHVARLFCEDLIATLEPRSVLCTKSDVIAFPFIYLQTIEGMAKDVTLVIWPLLSEEWYVRQLRRRDPDLAIPFDRQTNNLKSLVDANQARTIVIGTTGNYRESLGGDYWLYQQGLVMMVEPSAKRFTMEEMVADNERLLRQYRPPAPDSIKAGSFEEQILTLYAWPALRIGNDYELVGLKSEARKWYERSLAIDPQLPQIREALARVKR
jgi:hypothetical protein